MELKSETVYLSLGSNLGNRVANLEQALHVLPNDYLTVCTVSSMFETEPVGYQEQPWFLNMALAAETRLSPRELLERCLEVERRLGRVRSIAGGPRTVDIDILLFGNRVIREEDLVIPHPRMIERRFVLQPLSEIAPFAHHPVLDQAVRSLLDACTDPSTVRLYSSGDDS